jgi:hypothetical protein
VEQNSSRNHDHLHEINHSMNGLVSLHLNMQSERQKWLEFVQLDK